jgi:leucyl aminopeptidase
MKLLLILLVISFSSYAKDGFILVESKVSKSFAGQLDHSKNLLGPDQSYKAFKVSDGLIGKLSEIIHKKFNRCGGYFYFESLAKLKDFRNSMNTSLDSVAFDFFKSDFNRDFDPAIQKSVDLVQEKRIRDFIIELSSFKNRYYQSATGVAASSSIQRKWGSIARARGDIEVKLYSHVAWDQPSVIVKIQGTTRPNEAAVLGGHLDSINQIPFFTKHLSAPGADDNASGISTLTEVLQVIVDSNYRPERTIFIMGYAAEEVGLRGSKEIALSFAKENKYAVKGVLQLDMTNYQGSENEIYFIQDYTSASLTSYLGQLVDQYVNVPWGYSKCGYACSDHASWHAQNFPAAFPFEASFRDSNPHIHSAGDTIDKSAGTADLAASFAKLGVAFAMGLGQ